MASERKPRGMETKDAATRQRIASSGGKAVQASGRAHKFTSEQAQAAGRKGAEAKKKKNS